MENLKGQSLLTNIEYYQDTFCYLCESLLEMPGKYT